jgi:hypothetical protein
MGEAFRLGGWGMYPTAIVGLVLVAAAVQCARQPDARRFRLVRHLSVLTFLVATLGFITGVIKSFIAAGSAEPHELGGLVITGVGESLNNIGLGLVLLVIASIAASVGAYRAGSRSDGAELTDPHGP